MSAWPPRQIYLEIRLDPHSDTGLTIQVHDAGAPILVTTFDTARDAGVWLEANGYTWLAGSRAVWERPR